MRPRRTICFGFSLAAVNAHVSVDTVIVVYVLGSTLGGAAPTPGGLGAVEAALVAGLTAAGTDPTWRSRACCRSDS